MFNSTHIRSNSLCGEIIPAIICRERNLCALSKILVFVVFLTFLNKAATSATTYSDFCCGIPFLSSFYNFALPLAINIFCSTCT